jgi:type IV pilus assembly protein PilC
LIPLIPIGLVLFIKLVTKFRAGKKGWDLFLLKMPIFGQLVEKNIVARTVRTLGTLVSSGVPILESLNITKETSGNAVFEDMYQSVYDAIREGESIAKPLKENAQPPFNGMALFFWAFFIEVPTIPVVLFFGVYTSIMGIIGGIVSGALAYMMRMNSPIVDDMVINMVDVGEETGELDTMLYKVADTYDEEVAVLTDGLMSLMEPLLIIMLGGIVGFIVIALFMPLIKLITSLSA